MEKPFTKELQEFLIARCDEINIEEVSSQFKQADSEADRLYAELKALLSEEGQKMLLRFNDRHCDRMAAAANAVYQKGFAEGLQFIVYLLIS